MIVNKKDVEDIRVELNNSTLIIKYPEVNYSYWKGLIPYNNDKDLSIILDGILIDLDCSIIYNQQRLIYTNNMMYEYNISKYYYYLIHIENQLIHNDYWDYLLITHKDNIQFELNNPVIINIPKVKTKIKAKVINKDKFIKQTTIDLITNKEIYIYINKKTNEEIRSEDPDLLNTLNGKVKKEKKVKQIGVPVELMTFSFKKKNND